MHQTLSGFDVERPVIEPHAITGGIHLYADRQGSRTIVHELKTAAVIAAKKIGIRGIA